MTQALFPKELLPYASAVIRNKEETVEVKDLDNVIKRVKEVVTVLNKNGDDFAHIVVYHDKMEIIKYIKGAVYNGSGKQIGKFSERDFDDESAAHDFSLFEDARLKHYLPAITEYPYTIAYEYEVHLKQSLNLPKWEPGPFLGAAVEKSTYKFICNPDFNIRYKQINIQGKVNIQEGAGHSNICFWMSENLKAIKDEPYSPFYKSYSTSVQIVPEKFSFYGINGTFTNWKDLGKWEYDKLLANRCELPPETIEHIKEFTRDINDPKLKGKKDLRIYAG